jgi:parallel beta-helix repeat protein
MSSRSLRAQLLAVLTGSLALACGGGGGGGGSPPPVDPLQSSFTLTPAFGTPADGLGAVEAVVVLADAAGQPLAGRTVVLETTGFVNALVQPAATDAAGATRGELRTSVGEKKLVTAIVDPGPSEVRLGPVTAEFLRILPHWRFVRASGSDASDGRGPLTAWRTLGHAVAQLAPGQVLFVGAGTYSDPLVLAHAATAAEPLVIRGDRTGELTGDAGEVLLDLGGMPVGIDVAGASHVTLRGLSVRGCDVGIRATGASALAVLDCRVYENGHGIELDTTSQARLEGNRISANAGDGIVLRATAGTRVLGNLVYANGGDGIELASASSDLVVELGTLYRNGGDQVREVVAGTTGVLANNVLSEGLGLGLGLAPGSALVNQANLTWLQAGNTQAGEFSGDPLLADPDGADGILGGIGADDDDFRVLPASPTLDVGSVSARQRVLALAGQLAAQGSRADGLLDGEGADLVAANLGFHSAPALDAFASLEPRGARAAFARAGDARARTRAWSRTTDAWAAPRVAQALGSEVRWLVHRVSSAAAPEELLAAQIDTGAGAFLAVRTWDARRWSDDAPATLAVALAPANADERAFDAEYEELSGHALLVHADGAQNVIARTLVDGVWSPAAPVFAPALATGTLLWTELVARPASDEIALVALDDQQKLVAAVWDGAAWTRPILLAAQVNSLRDFRAFDAAFESLSGDLLVAWGYSQFAEETRYATLHRATDTWLTGQFVSTDALGKTLALASDPASDRIVAIFGEGATDDDVGVSVWGGSGWSDTAELTLAGVAQSRALVVGWLGTSGEAFALYRDQAQTGTFQWARLNSGGWRRETQVSLSGVGKLVQAVAHRVPDTQRVLLLLLDDAGSLWAVEHDGAAWKLANGDAALATGLDPANPGRAFDLDVRGL